MYQKILVAIDGSETADRALKAAIDLAKSFGSKLRIVFAADELPMTYDLPAALLEDTRKHILREGKSILKKAAFVAKSSGADEVDTHLIEGVVTGGRIAELIVADAVQWSASLIVVGTHGRRGVSRFFLGSVAQDVMRLAGLPVLIVPAS